MVVRVGPVQGLARARDILTNGVGAEIDRQLRSRALAALGDLRLETPVDTGRARNSWDVNRTGQLFDSDENPPPGLSILEPSPTIRTRIFITNGTPYIQYLNQGTSIQAPARFIETTLMRYFGTLVAVDVVEN